LEIRARVPVLVIFIFTLEHKSITREKKKSRCNMANQFCSISFFNNVRMQANISRDIPSDNPWGITSHNPAIVSNRDGIVDAEEEYL
jgi:hypothetical protein